MKKYNYSKGKQGEDEARKHLVDKGFGYIESNFEIESGEIDLIMSDKDTLVFVEVKFKSDDSMGIPEEMINRRKVAQVKRIAEIYLIRNPNIRSLFARYRIDAVCILGNKIRHYQNIYA